MELFLFDLQRLFKKLDKADGEAQIAPVMEEILQCINDLPASQQKRANQEFDYYLAKRVARMENKIEKLKYDFHILA